MLSEDRMMPSQAERTTLAFEDRVTKSTFQTYDLPSDSGKLPRSSGGIYFFSIRFPSDYELGFDTGITHENILRNLEARLDRYSIAYARCPFSGTSTDGKAEHMRASLTFSGAIEPFTRPGTILSELTMSSASLDDLRNVTRVLRFAFSTHRPLYIGICFDQSFHERISQHIAGNTGLSEFLRECHMSIGDIRAHCLPPGSVTKKIPSPLRKTDSIHFSPVIQHKIILWLNHRHRK